MENEKGNGNGNTVLLTVIGVATLLVALVGATFAYFSATLTSNNEQSVILTTAAPVGLEYVGSTITMSNIIPGQSESGTFRVTNPASSTVAQTYDLILKIDKNELTTATNPDAADNAGKDSLPGQLLVSVSGKHGITLDDEDAFDYATATGMPINIENCSTTDACDFTDSIANPANTTNKVLVNDQRVEPGETDAYLINVNFVDLKVNQNANMNKAFQAHIEITDATSVR